MQTLPAVSTLRTMWEQPFEPFEQGGRWRLEPLLPAAQLLTSPYDLDARNGKKRSTFWTGYKVHFTQTCDDDAPQLITQVQTTPAPSSDEGVLSALHANLLRRSCSQISISLIRAIRRWRIWSPHDLTMRWTWSVLRSKRDFYQAETGYDLTHFSINWEAEQVRCPQRCTSSSWTPVEDAGKSSISVKFSQSDCKVCPARDLCTGTTRRTLTLHPKEQALFAARQREETDEFKDAYRHRAGIEGVHSQAVRALGLRRSRYSGLRKTHLGHVALAAAINVIQLMSWLRGERPEQTRTSAFKRVMELAA